MNILSRSCAFITVGLALGACSSGPRVDSPLPAKAPLPPVPYTTLVGNAALTRVAAYEQNGYQVETDQVAVRDSLPGALVTVRSADGSLYAIVDTPDKKGTWRIAVNGASTFVEDLPFKAFGDDTLPGPASQPLGQPASQSEPYKVDVLMGYSKASAVFLGDPIAHALAQVAYVNLLLSNTRISGVSLSLAGVQLVDENFTIDGTLGRVSTIFARGLADASADIAGAWSARNIRGAYGWGFVPGRYTSQTVHTSTTFAHEVGHNIGGSHCNTGQASYAFGYNNGRSSTSLCGKSVPYYSNPQILDTHGLPLGDANTADMARVWRERASVMAGYASALPGVRLIVASVDANTSATLTLPTDEGQSVGVVVVDAVTEGPRSLDGNATGYTRLVAKLSDKFGTLHDVVLRGERLTACSTRPIQYFPGCTASGGQIQLRISMLEADNPTLVGGMLTGKMGLRALDGNAAAWGSDVTVLLSVNRPAKVAVDLDNTSTAGAISKMVRVPATGRVGVVAMGSAEGPVDLIESSDQSFSMVSKVLSDRDGVLRTVHLRARRTVDRCQSQPMNAVSHCVYSAGGINLEVSYLPMDNPDLPVGTWVGNIQLAARNEAGTVAQPMEINLAIKK